MNIIPQLAVTMDGFWPLLIFLGIVVVLLVQAWWNRRRIAVQRQQSLKDYAAETLARQRDLQAEAEAQKSALFDSMIEGLLILDENGKIELVNQSLQKKLNRRILTNIVISQASLPEVLNLFNQVRTQLEPIVERLIFPGGVIFEVSAAQIKDYEGRYHGCILVFHDITRLEELERVRREFVANVSHELRTPLSLIKGYTETLLEGAKDDPETATRFIQKIEKHVNRLSFLIEDLLHISKLESGGEQLNLSECNLHEVVSRVEEELRDRIREKSLVLRNLVPQDLHPSLDVERIHQVFFNLVENACNYSPANGEVQITAEADKGVLKICVRDNGIGFPQEEAERIFARFYRTDRARARHTGGTGLGLSIVKHIVGLHGGKVWAESEPGKGARFHTHLPMVP